MDLIVNIVSFVGLCVFTLPAGINKDMEAAIATET